MAHKIICYTEMSKTTLLRAKVTSKKVHVVPNTVHNPHSLTPSLKHYDKNDILFVGRLRNGSSVSMLIEAVNNLFDKYQGLSLIHI